MKKLFLLLFLITLMSLKGWADNQGYAIFDETTGVLTFKYGEKPEGENVYDTDTPIDDDEIVYWLNDSWFSKRGYIKKAVIEESFENVKPVSTHSWFYCQDELEEIVGLNHINGSDLVSMKRMFSGCSKLTNIDLSGLMTDHVTDMSQMFEKCSFTSLNLSCLNTENVTNMNSMFSACNQLSSINLTGFKTDKVTDMSRMFDGCNCLQEIDLSSFNTENVTDMSQMFAFCDLISLDLRSFNTVNVTTMEGMFLYCSKLVNLDISSFRTDKVVNLSNMFGSCKMLTVLDISHFNTENVTTMFGLFSDCEKLQNLDISTFNTQKVTNMSCMFSNCYSLKSIDLHHFDTSNVTDFEGMFRYCSIESIDLSNFGTHNMTRITRLFDHCSKLTEMDLTNFDTRNLTEYGYVFQSCSKLEIVKFGENFNTAKVSGEYVNWGFQNCSALKEIWINGDVPELISTTFGRVGEFGTVILRVPKQYKQNYADHFVDGAFCGGSFVLDVLPDNGGESSIPPSIPDFGTKRLTKITWTDGKETETAELRYDDTGRIKEYLIDGKVINQYTYSDNTISISEDGDSYEYNISDGRVISGKTFLDGDYVSINRTFMYNTQAQLVSIVNKEKEKGDPDVSIISEKWDWNGDNLSSWSEDAWGDLETSSFIYNDMTAEPMMCALFGFSQARHLDDFYEILAIYPYLGSIPKNLFQTVKHKDAEKRDFEYSYTYEQKANGDIGKVSISYKDETYVFTLDWGDSDASEMESSEEVITISTALQVPYCSEYNLDFTDKPELKAYVATGYDKSKGTIWLTRVKQVPAGTGFLLTGEEGDYEVPVSESASNCYYKNMFKGTLEGTTIQTTDGKYTNYYLSNGTAGVGFYKVTKEEGVKVGANRCYLPILTEIPANGSTGDTELIKVSAAKQVPYYTSKNLDFTTMEAQGVKAYTATGYNYNTGVIWLTRVKKVPAQTGILVMTDKSGEYNVPTASVQSVYENMFVGSETAQTIYTTETVGDIEYINYYLSNGASGVGFYKVTNPDGVKMGANRCYLPIPKRDAASGARGKNGESAFCKMVLSDESNDDVIAIPLFTDGTTGIDIQSSIFNLQSNEVYYNLQGQRVENPGKGLYIRNGKKVVIK